MKAENRIPITTKPRDSRSTKAKAVAVPVWTPQPIPLTREEIRRLVLEQIG